MQKLKLTIIDKMIEMKLSSTEINFMIYISRYQDDQGTVIGIYYKEICSALNISYQKFYDILASLEQKSIIKISKEYYSDWNIQILNNEFLSASHYKEGYINTNQAIFYSKDFFSLKAGEKLLAMQFLKIANAGRGSYNISLENFYNKYTLLFGINKRSLQNYLRSLKTFFTISIKEGLYWITPLSKVHRKNGSTSEIDNYIKGIGKAVFRRQKLDYSEKSFNDTVSLIKQYLNTLREKTVDTFISAVEESILKANKNIKNKRHWIRLLQPKLVHKIISNKIVSLGF